MAVNSWSYQPERWGHDFWDTLYFWDTMGHPAVKLCLALGQIMYKFNVLKGKGVVNIHRGKLKDSDITQK